jgi:hypothetical protein
MPSVRVGPPGAPDWVLAAIPVALAIAVNRRALGVGFTPDDLQLLEVARGIVSAPNTLWRVVSRRLYFAATLPVFGTQPLGFHVLSLLLHAAVTLLVAVWARRLGASRAAAFLAAALFGVSALHMTVVWQACTAGESLAAIFTIGAALWLSQYSRGRQALGAASHGIALLCKENVALAPLSVLAISTREQRAASLRALGPAMALSIAAWVYILAMRHQLGGIAGEAYAFGWGTHVFANLLTYARWSADLFRLAPAKEVSGVANMLTVVAMFVLCAYAIRSRSAAARAGLTLWITCLLPVLPLEHQVYEHYLYLPFVGFAVATGCAITALARRLSSTFRTRPEAMPIAGWLIVLGLVFAQALATEAVFQQRLQTRIPALGLPLDSMLRKMQFAANAQRDLTAALPPTAARLVIVSPPGASSTYNVRTGQVVQAAPTGAPAYNMLAAVLDDGRALRALFPQLLDVRLTEHLLPADTSAVLATNRVDGHLVVFGGGPQAHIAMAGYWASLGLTPSARIHLAEAAALYPESAELAPFGSPAREP